MSSSEFLADLERHSLSRGEFVRPLLIRSLFVLFIQFGTEFTFENFKPLANRRCADVHLPSGFAEVLMLGNIDEKLNAIE
jgi:hypothetical protein